MVDTRRRAGYLGQCSWGRTPDRSRLGLLISGQDTSPEPHLHRLAVNNGLSRVPPGEVPSIERVLSPGRSRTYDHERFVVKRAAPTPNGPIRAYQVRAPRPGRDDLVATFGGISLRRRETV